jgi:hypothetical protein
VRVEGPNSAPNASVQAQTSKIGQNSQIVIPSRKFDGDYRHASISHPGIGIFHPSEQDLSRDQQAHWLHGTSGQNPQF